MVAVVGLAVGWVLTALLWVWTLSLVRRMVIVAPVPPVFWMVVLMPGVMTVALTFASVALLNEWKRAGAARDGACPADSKAGREVKLPTRVLIPAIPLLCIWIALPWLGNEHDTMRAVLFSVGAIGTLIWFPFLARSRRRYERERQGLCRRCGYDIRASAERCPECGEEIAR
jgi:uncharacterized membrane protein YciS (DUF1049 family)